MSIGEKIKDLRFEKGLSQKKLAELIGVSQQVFVWWENNKHEPKATYLKALASFFEVTSDYLIGLSDDTTGYVEPAQAAPAIPTPPIVPLYNQLMAGDKLRAEEYIKKMLAEPQYANAAPSLA